MIDWHRWPWFRKAPEVLSPPNNKESTQMSYKDKDGKLLINKNGMELVQHFEALYLTAYQDSVNVWTIGWGRILHPDGRKVKAGDTCTKAEADAWLLEDLYADGAGPIRRLTEKEDGLSEDQFSALVSFTYNRGSGRYDQKLDDLVDAGLADNILNAVESGDICKAIASYNWAGSPPKYLLGLDRRRWAEQYLFQGKDWRVFTSLDYFKAFKDRGYQ